MRSVIYCDETCHLQNDESLVMGLGAIKAPYKHIRNAALELRDIKKRHNARGELKWVKVSPAKQAFYNEVIDWFFAQSYLNFRCLIVPDKSILDHNLYNDGNHDNFYYKMYFSLLNKILEQDSKNDIYLDIKDTRSKLKVAKLAEVLRNDCYDFTGQMVSKVQHARSHELELMQLVDLLLGAVVYCNRRITTSEAKTKLYKRIEDKVGRSLTQTFPLSATKFNVFIWRARS